LGNQKHSLFFPSGISLEPDRTGIAIPQVDTRADVLGDPRGEGDAGPWRLDAVLVSPQSVDVSGMGQHPPRIALESVPLFQKIIPAMVTHFQNRGPVADANFADMGGIDDQFAAIGQDRLQFVHAFPSHPKLVIHFRRAGNDGVERAVLEGNVKTAGKFAGRIPGAFRIARKQARQRFIRRHYQAKA
jgi:hypothetical protein